MRKLLFAALLALVLVSAAVYTTYVSTQHDPEQKFSVAAIVLATAQNMYQIVTLASDLSIDLSSGDTQIFIEATQSAPTAIHQQHITAFQTNQIKEAPTDEDLPPLQLTAQTSSGTTFITTARDTLLAEAQDSQQTERVILVLKDPTNPPISGEQYGNLLITDLTNQELQTITFDAQSPYELVTKDHTLRSTALIVDTQIQGPLTRATANATGATGVCVIDSGINYTLGIFNTNYVGGIDLVNNDSDPMDDYGHGTAMAHAIISIAPGAQLYVAKVTGATGQGYASDVIQAIDWCMQQNVTVISMSLRAGQYQSWCDDTSILAQKANEAAARGFFVTAATGNGGNDGIGSPACGSLVTSVAATEGENASEIVWSSSDINNITDLLAPGVNITLIDASGNTRTLYGTSVANAVVAGGAAVLTETTGLNASAIHNRMRATGTLFTHNSIQYPRLDLYNAYTNTANGLNSTQQGYQSNGTDDIVTLAACIDDNDCPDFCTFQVWVDSYCSSDFFPPTCDDFDQVGCDTGNTFCNGPFTVELGTCDDVTGCGATTVDTCDGMVCSGYGACDYSDSCDEDSQSCRTCSDEMCNNGACEVGSDYQDCTSCNRNTDGNSCGGGCSTGACSQTGGGICSTTGTATQTCDICSGGSCSDTTNNPVGCTFDPSGIQCDEQVYCNGPCELGVDIYRCDAGGSCAFSAAFFEDPQANGEVCDNGGWTSASCSVNCGGDAPACNGGLYQQTAYGCTTTGACSVSIGTCSAPADTANGNACSCNGQCTSSVCKNNVFDGSVTASRCTADNSWCVDNGGTVRASGTTVGDSACYGSATGGSVWLATSGRWIVKNTGNTVLAVVDKYGSMGVRGTSTTSAATFDNGWQLKDASSVVKTSVNSANGNLRTAGTISTRAIPSCTGFQVRNTAGTLEVCMSNTGNLQIRGDYAYNLNTLS
jgi:hypothetical protein